MDAARIRELLEAVRAGGASVDDAIAELKTLPAQELGFASVDHHRSLRQGMPEVIFGEGKTTQQIIGIAGALAQSQQNVLVTRLSADKAGALLEADASFRYNELARVAVKEGEPQRQRNATPVMVVTAGTSDIPVAEEAAETLAACGLAYERVFDVGVAGIHRLTRHLEKLSAAPVVIVVAGMEGALASVVGGMIGGPVIAVPTSVGYGASLSGFTALFGMLSSCASGVTVVNIDNGFGAAMAALRVVERSGDG